MTYAAATIDDVSFFYGPDHARTYAWIKPRLIALAARFAGYGTGATLLVVVFAAATGAMFASLSHVRSMRESAFSGREISQARPVYAPTGAIDLSGLVPLPFDPERLAQLVLEAQLQAGEAARVATSTPNLAPDLAPKAPPFVDPLPPARPRGLAPAPVAPLAPSVPNVASLQPEDRKSVVAPTYGRPAQVPAVDSRTAVYDIEARIVYMPNGERLEAHSGLGENMDDPASMRLKNRGVTPPNVYTLTMREQLFHGVAALRLNPVNPGAMFGRDGMLAHTYMLGPRGDSNGCVSFKDYPRFLNAFKRGEVTRLIVVARLGGSAPARLAAAPGAPGVPNVQEASDQL
jgi:hypothetical protein